MARKEGGLTPEIAAEEIKKAGERGVSYDSLAQRMARGGFSEVKLHFTMGEVRAKQVMRNGRVFVVSEGVK